MITNDLAFSDHFVLQYIIEWLNWTENFAFRFNGLLATFELE